MFIYLFPFELSCTGQMTLGDILEILPFEDPIVVLELDGATIWDALEASLATWPAQEGSAFFQRLTFCSMSFQPVPRYFWFSCLMGFASKPWRKSSRSMALE
jgi:hypothetical protein